jgi:hypothetical protein
VGDNKTAKSYVLVFLREDGTPMSDISNGLWFSATDGEIGIAMNKAKQLHAIGSFKGPAIACDFSGSIGSSGRRQPNLLWEME